METSSKMVDVMIHIDPETDQDEREYLRDMILKQNGVDAAAYHDDKPHLMLIEYDPGRSQLKTIIKYFIKARNSSGINWTLDWLKIIGRQMRIKLGLIKILVISTLLISYNSNATNGYFSHGNGIKNRALAGAGVAFPQDAMAGATNPAGMAFIGNRLDVGAVLFFPDRAYSSSSSLANGFGGAFTIGPDSEASGDNSFFIPSFGINKMISDNTTIGMSVYGNGGLNTTYNGGTASFDPDGPGPAPAGSTFPGVFGAGTAGADLFQIFFNFSIAHKFSENVSVGISPLIAIQGFRANGLEAFAGFTKTFAQSGGMSVPDDLTSNGQEYSFGAGVQVGMLVKNIANMIDFGASYRSKIYMDEFDGYADLFAEDGDFDIPPTLWLGFAVHPTPSITILFDFQRIWYEEVDSISNDIQNLFACPTAGAGGTDIEKLSGWRQWWRVRLE